MHTHTHAHTHIHNFHIQVSTHTHTCTCMCLSAGVCACMCVCVRARTYECMFVCVRAYVCVCVCACVRVYTSVYLCVFDRVCLSTFRGTVLLFAFFHHNKFFFFSQQCIQERLPSIETLVHDDFVSTICPPLFPSTSIIFCFFFLFNNTFKKGFRWHTSIWRLPVMGWLRLVGSIKSWVSFAKEPYKRDNILQTRPRILSILLEATHSNLPSLFCGSQKYIPPGD